MIEQHEDPERQAWRATQDRIRAELFPIRKPVQYESEEQLYDRVRATFETFWDPPDDRYLDVVSSCVLFSHRIRQFNTTPYLFAFGPPDSGKSRLMDLLRRLCRNALKSSSVSPAAIYQFLTETHGSLLVDETDKWGLNGKSGPNERTLELVQILNSGYRRGDYAVRANRDGGRPIYYDTFGFKAGAGTELWPPTLLERCIVLYLNENTRPIPSEINDKALEPLQGMLELYYVNYDLGKSAVPELQPREIDLEMDELRDLIGDNRVAELYYGSYVCCPTSQGRAALLSLAKENAESRERSHADSDMGQVAESVLSVWLQEGMPEFITVDEVSAWHSDFPPGVKDRNSWLGHKLRKLGFVPYRLAHGGPRGVLVTDEKMARLDRQFRLFLERLPLKPTSAIVHQVEPIGGPSSAKSGTSGTTGTQPPESAPNPETGSNQAAGTTGTTGTGYSGSRDPERLVERIGRDD